MSRTGWLVFGGLGFGALVVVLVLCGGAGFFLFRAGSAVNAEISTLASGYSLPSVNVVVSDVSMVERVRNVSPDEVSWNTT